MTYSLGIDIGSSSVKIALVRTSDGEAVSSAQFPKEEMPMTTHEKSWAEQNPSMWWEALLECLKSTDDELLSKITHIGISKSCYRVTTLR